MRNPWRKNWEDDVAGRSIVAPHVRCATPFLLNLFRSCTLLIAAMPKGLAGESGPS